MQVDPAALKSQLAAAQDVPAELKPALKFQQVFVAILSAAPITDWRADLETLAHPTATDPVSQGVADVAKTWLARVWQDDLADILRRYYGQHVVFPATLDALGNMLPENLRNDPWGDPWVYSLHAPTGFEHETAQRYQLGPKRYPQLASLSAAIAKRTPPKADWKITVQEVAGTRSLQFASSTGNALIQPGGSVDGDTLLYIGAGWALLAGPDQLFTVKF